MSIDRSYVRDHPVISQLERTGRPYHTKLKICPFCGEEYTYLVRNQFYEPVACNVCAIKDDMEDYDD